MIDSAEDTTQKGPRCVVIRVEAGTVIVVGLKVMPEKPGAQRDAAQFLFRRRVAIQCVIHVVG